MRRFAAFGLLVMRRFAGLLLWGVCWLRWFLCTLQHFLSPSRRAGWAHRAAATLWQETVSSEYSSKRHKAHLIERLVLQ